MLLTALSVSAASVAGLLAFVKRQQDCRAFDLTPTQLIESFRAAGYDIGEVDEIEHYPGPLSPGKEGLEFSTRVADELVQVLVIQHSDCSRPRRAAKLTNQLNQRMGGMYAYAFSRGHLALVVFTQVETTAQDFDAVLHAVE